MSGATFDLSVIRFEFQARGPIRFPPGKAGNLLRGAWGAALYGSEQYRRIFRPEAATPSGLHDPPRPFVFRAAHLDGRSFEPGERFHFDLHWFAGEAPPAETFALRGATLLNVASQPVTIPLDPPTVPVYQAVVRFLTPTELKGGSQEPEFGILFARARDRASTLRALYGAGPIEIDFREMGERAGQVRLLHCEIRHLPLERRSRGTGQTHPLGGFTGEAKYAGILTEFMPYLETAKWTGIGRQTVWGKGAIDVEISATGPIACPGEPRHP